MAQNPGMSIPGVASDASNMSGQAGGGSGAVFGGLGGGVQQGSDLPQMPGGPRNSGGHPTGNPSGDPAWGEVPPLDSVFGTDLGGSGVAGQERGAAIPNIAPSTGPPGPNIAPSTGPPGQGGR